MSRLCASCTAPFAAELNRQLHAGASLTLVSAWTAAQGSPISPAALSRHRRDHAAIVSAAGRKPISTDILEAVRDDALSRLEAGEVRATLKDGLQAQSLLDKRLQQKLGEEWQYKLILALTGHSAPRLRVIDPEHEIMDAEFTALLEGGTATDAQAAVDEARERLGIPAEAGV